MRINILLAVVAMYPLAAHADKKLDDLRALYGKEQVGCVRSRDGLVKVVDGATALSKTTMPPTELTDLQKDLEELNKLLVVMKDYCTELDRVMAVLNENLKGNYKTLEKDLDARDNRIRKGRAAAKKGLEAIAPINRRLIPKINAARVSAPDPAPEKRTSTKFPSGRAIDLPSLPGTWKVSGSAAIDTAQYADKTTTAVIATRSFAKATCDQQKRVANTADDTGIQAVDAKPFAWAVRFTRKGRAMQTGCATIGDGGIIATLDVTPGDAKLLEATAALWIRMAQVRVDVK